MKKPDFELALDASYARPCSMTDEDWYEALLVQKQMEDMLAKATLNNDVECLASQQAVLLHRRWLCLFLPEGSYSYPGHKAMVQGYLDDPRQKAMYDNIAPGAAEFLWKCLNFYCLD